MQIQDTIEVRPIDLFIIEIKEDLMKSGQYVEMNYSHFLKVWLQACQQRAEADKVRMFLGDFIDYIDETFYITQ